MLAVIIPLLALLGTFYQLYLQRVHNEKSLKPLVQIDVMDRGPLIYVHVQNNGVGPLIIDRLTFLKDGKSYFSIVDCLDLDPKSYQHNEINESVKKVLLPGGFHEIFSTKDEKANTDEELAYIRQQLSVLSIKVEGRDIYDNKVVAERNMHWFSRHDSLNDTVKV